MSQSRPAAEPADSSRHRPRRATVRYRCAPATIGKLYVSGDQVFQSAWVQNLSATGIGMILPHAVDVGVFITIQMKSTDLRQTFELSGQIVHCTQQPGGDWTVGCELLQPLSPEDLDSLL